MPRRTDVEGLKKSTMMSEGAPVLSAYFNSDIAQQAQTDKERLAAKAMIDEGGIGAEVYYMNEEKIANLDTQDNHSSLH